MGTSKATDLLQAKSCFYVDWVKQKALKTARTTADILFSSFFGLQIIPFIAQLDVVNMPSPLIKLKIQMLHSLTPLINL